MCRLRKSFYVSFGLVAVVLGALGVILPILPTVPFLLLASFCFARGSKRFEAWFCRTGLYKKYLADYVKQRTMTREQKRMILGVASAMLLIPLIIVDNMAMRITILALVIGKYYYILRKVPTRHVH